MSDAEYKQVLLDDRSTDRDDCGDLVELIQKAKAYKWRQSAARSLCTRVMLLNVGLLVANIALAVYLVVKAMPHTCRELTYSPLHSVISHQVQDFITDEDHLWTGHPTPETEANWHNLLLGFDVRISKDDTQKLGRMENAVEINDERGGYAALINVYHELHCLKLVRWSLYPDYYYPNSTKQQTDERERHRDHCLNYIRQSAMCHADVGVSTWHWRPDDNMPHADMMPHSCRDWAAVDRWAKNRRIDMYQPGLLVHPKFGVAFPNGLGANEDDGGS